MNSAGATKVFFSYFVKVGTVTVQSSGGKMENLQLQLISFVFRSCVEPAENNLASMDYEMKTAVLRKKGKLNKVMVVIWLS